MKKETCVICAYKVGGDGTADNEGEIETSEGVVVCEQSAIGGIDSFQDGCLRCGLAGGRLYQTADGLNDGLAVDQALMIKSYF